MVINNAKPNNKTLGGIIAVVALISGIGAIVMPMKQRIDQNAQSLRDHALREGHSNMIGRMAGMQERFMEIETQFRNLDERTLRMNDLEQERVEVINTLLQMEIVALQASVDKQLEFAWERIRQLEKEKP